MKSIVLVGLLCVAACSSTNKPLAMIDDRDPVVQLNPDRWAATVNDLTTPTVDGGNPQSLPAPIKAPKTLAATIR